MPSTIHPETTIDFGSITLTGILEHDSTQATLMLHTDEGPEVLSTNLNYYGLVGEPGCVFIKDWSEHAGLAERVQAAGLVRIIRTVELKPMGPMGHRVRAHEVLVL